VTELEQKVTQEMETIKIKLREMEEERQHFADISGLKAREEERKKQVQSKKEQTESVLKEQQNLLKRAQETHNKLQVRKMPQYFAVDQIACKIFFEQYFLLKILIIFRKNFRTTTFGRN
jgi:CRISPR/Cas system CSM-associated protein Csm4 (group 5 of RAMP superfamily)